MKYWLLTTEYPPLHGGGISTYCHFTVQMMAATGTQVTVFVNDDSQADFTIIDEASNIRLVRFNSNREKLDQSLGFTARLSYAFAGIVQQLIAEKGQPDFIEAQDYLGIAYYLTQYKQLGYTSLAGIPIVLTLHSPAFIYLLYNRVPVYRFPDFWTGEMEKQSIAAADALIAPTRFMLEETEKHVSLSGIQKAVISNPYKFQAAPGTLSFKRNKIIYYGKLSPQKGSFELLVYFKALWDDGFMHPLHIIGGTDIVFHPEMQTMGQLVNKDYAAYIERGLLQLHGKIQPSQIQDHLQDAHVVIVPSIVDNMPYVVMEAMSCGKIVLASVQGGQREMIDDGVSGFLFSHDDPGSFNSQLIKILALTDKEIKMVGNNALQRVSARYHFDTVWQQKSAFLNKLAPAANNHFPFLYQEPVQPVAATQTIQGLLSVVIPYYNMGAYIEECTSSIMQSSYTAIEIIIVNDGSTDPLSIDKLQPFRKQGNTKVIDTLNQGLAKTRNAGATAARGEFLAFLDADDKIASTYYEKTIAALTKNNNVFFAGAWVQYFENSLQLWPTFTPQPPYALAHNPINSSGLVYKKAAFLAGGWNDKEAGYGLEDYESVVSMLAMGFNGVVIPEPLFYYRVRTGSMIRSVTQAKLLYSNLYIAEKHRNYYNRFALGVIHLLNANGPGYLYDNPTFATNVSVKTSAENWYISRVKAFIKKNEPLKKIAIQILKIKYKR